MARGKVTGQCSRYLVLSLKVPSSSWGEALLLQNNSKIRVCIFFVEESGPCIKAALLLLDCSSLVHIPSPPQMSNDLNLPLGTRGRSRRLKEAHFLQTRREAYGKDCVWERPTGSCPISI